MLPVCLLTITTILFTVFGFGQNRSKDDSLIYLMIIKSTIPLSAKSVLIVNETVKYKHEIDTASIVDSNSTDPNEVLTRKYEWENATKTPFDSIAYRPMMRYYLGRHNRIKIAYGFSLPFKIVYLSGADYETGKETEEYWDNLNRKYPNAAGVLSFSEIFYSADGSRAVLYYSIRRKNGKGSVVLSSKIKGRWKLKFENNVWHN